MREKSEREIEGIRVMAQMLPGTKAQRLFFRLTKLAGPTLIRALSSGAKKVDDVSPQAFVDAAELFFERFTPDDYEEIARDLLNTVSYIHPEKNTVLPVWGSWDTLTMGRLSLAFKIIGFALEVNYASFFGDKLETVKTAIRAAAQSSEG